MTPEQRAALLVKPEITFADAMKAIERHAENRAYWMVRAQTLLHMVGKDGINQEKLAVMCETCAQEMP